MKILIKTMEWLGILSTLTSFQVYNQDIMYSYIFLTLGALFYIFIPYYMETDKSGRRK